ncbi:fumarylacetoacetase [Desulfosediminicola ganghwensis]|uniref:fumarylacetoacetase n=1 Tax=Desulfosediminicola ganghwensis TaxID=2569540 RepID=UPI0010AC1A15|nr:fumarylacetoacetase [Desulfosediminicola ganghwensis]
MTASTDPTLRSFVDYDQHSHFPIQNLPYGVFSHDGTARIGARIGELVLDLALLETEGFFVPLPRLFNRNSLNLFFAAGPSAWSQVRTIISRLLNEQEPTLRDNHQLRSSALLPVKDVTMHLPAIIGDYTDFYSSREHATNVGTMFRGPENALMPNWLHLPVAYHGRSSSVVVSDTPIHRPVGQVKADDSPIPEFAATRSLDFELEMGFFIGPGSALGRPVTMQQAMDHVFGMVLVNDWSARDIQKWEYQPLGPFTAKNFATSISPWVVPIEALSPFRRDAPVQSPEVLPYLQSRERCTYDINLEVYIGNNRVCRSNFRNLYWTMSQQLAHHTATGCNILPGDLMASGTISGPEPGSFGSMLELSWKGTQPVAIGQGKTRTFLQDGDTVTMTGWCQGDGYRVGFGEVRGTILPPY